MRFMEMIRKKGGTCLGIFLVVFLVSVFAGIGISGGGFSFRGCSAERPDQQIAHISPQLVTDVPELADAVLTVNGRQVSERSFFEKIQILTRGRSSADNPGMQLQAYGYATNYAISEEVIAAKGEELNIEVTAQDIKETREEIIKQQLAGIQQGQAGNLIAEAARWMDNSRARKKAFKDYLSRNQLTESSWEQRIRMELFQSKTQEAWQELIDVETVKEADETKAYIDQRLEAGDSFESLAVEFSEDPNAAASSTMEPFWLTRGLVLKNQEDAAFDAADGTITDWIDVPAGWHRFEVIEHKLAEGDDFESERENIITALKATSDDDEYEPTDAQIARKYEQVRVRQLMLKTSVPGAVNQRIKELVEQADIQVNNPYILAYQALYHTKLQPPRGMGLAELTTISEMAPVGEGYDFNLIQEYLDATADSLAGADEPVASEDVPEDVEPAGGETAAADPVVDETEAELPPLYALATGLLKLGLQDLDADERATYFHYFIVGQTILDWLKDEESHDRQPIDRDAARADAEEFLSRAAEYYEYSAPIHAARGLNLAWLGNETEALASIELALKYAPEDAYNPIYQDVRKAYEILDATAKLEELDALEAAFRQVQLQRMMEEAGQGQNSSNVVTIPPGGDLDEALEQAQDEGGGWVKLSGEDDGEGDAAAEEDGGEGDADAEEAGGEAGTTTDTTADGEGEDE